MPDSGYIPQDVKLIATVVETELVYYCQLAREVQR